MAAAVETMAYTNQTPWHGLGVQVEDTLSVDDMLIKAGLDWSVEKHKMFTRNTETRKEIKIPNVFALVRSTDERVLSTVGPQWKPIQNHQAFSFFKEFVEAGDAKMETAGSLHDGKYVWGLANLGDSFHLINKAGEKDTVKGYLLVANPHQYGVPIVCKFTTIRVVCNNTLTLSLGEKNKNLPEFRTGHRMEFTPEVIQRAKETMGIAREQLKKFEENAHILQNKTISEEDAKLFLAKFFDPNKHVIDIRDHFEERASKPLQKVWGAYNDAPGAQPGNGWGLLNAVTYYADHMASPLNDNIRLESSWIGFQSRVKEKVLSDLLAA